MRAAVLLLCLSLGQRRSAVGFSLRGVSAVRCIFAGRPGPARLLHGSRPVCNAMQMAWLPLCVARLHHRIRLASLGIRSVSSRIR